MYPQQQQLHRTPNGSTLHAAAYTTVARGRQAAVSRVWPLLCVGQVCWQRNIHSRSLEDIQRLAAVWQDPPVGYNHVDLSHLLPSTANTEEGELPRGFELKSG